MFITYFFLYVRILFGNIITLVPTGAGKYTGMPDAFLILVLSGGVGE